MIEPMHDIWLLECQKPVQGRWHLGPESLELARLILEYQRHSIFPVLDRAERRDLSDRPDPVPAQPMSHGPPLALQRVKLQARFGDWARSIHANNNRIQLAAPSRCCLGDFAKRHTSNRCDVSRPSCKAQGSELCSSALASRCRVSASARCMRAEDGGMQSLGVNLAGWRRRAEPTGAGADGWTKELAGDAGKVNRFERCCGVRSDDVGGSFDRCSFIE
jgi:hypothetical protein